MNEYLFSYGTLQKVKVQKELFARILKGSKDVLRGYKTAFIEIEDKAFLSKGEQKYQLTAIASQNKNDSIEGTVFELSKEELLLTDQYEPDGYQRVNIELASGKRAWMYAFNHN